MTSPLHAQETVNNPDVVMDLKWEIGSWTDIWQNIFSADYPLFLLSDIFGDFYFTEASMLFLVSSVIVGIIGGLGEKGTVNTIIAGVRTSSELRWSSCWREGSSLS